MREEDTVCVGSDGLPYCKVCGEAKEAFFPKGGFMGMKKHSRQCACDRKAYEEEQKYFKDKEHRELVKIRASVLTRAEWKSGHLRRYVRCGNA